MNALCIKTVANVEEEFVTEGVVHRHKYDYYFRIDNGPEAVDIPPNLLEMHKSRPLDFVAGRWYELDLK